MWNQKNVSEFGKKQEKGACPLNGGGRLFFDGSRWKHRKYLEANKLLVVEGVVVSQFLELGNILPTCGQVTGNNGINVQLLRASEGFGFRTCPDIEPQAPIPDLCIELIAQAH